MNVKDLVCFIAAFDAGSSVAATHSARTSQSNISRRIRSLERSLGVELFTRIRYGLVPTRDARKLYPLARKVLAAVRRIEQAFAARSRSKR
jgi:DNA-binding transcriptional LysR family regulator